MAAPVPSETDAPPRGIPGLPPDWPELATHRVVATVDAVRAKSTGPAIRASRATVYGFVAAAMLVLILPLLLIGLVRGLVLLVDRAWLAYLILSVISLGVGLFLWSIRPKGAATPRRT